MGARIQVLGVMRVSVDGERPVGGAVVAGRRRRAVLARLVVARNAVVPVDRLIDDLWSGAPPPSALGALQVHVSYLRRALEPDRIARRPSAALSSGPGGYALSLPGDAVDAWRFEAALTGADGRREFPDTAGLYAALALWNGPAFADFADEPWVLAEAARLDELRSAAREHLAEGLLAEGEYLESASVATALTREQPLREGSWRLLALALYAGGRQGDALAALRRARSGLADELGVDPGAALQQLERDILAQTVSVPSIRQHAIPAAACSTSAAVGPVFIGRRPQLASLHAAADSARTTGTPGFALIVGDPGAGKSALLERFGQEAAINGWAVVTGRCPEADGAPPAWPWIQVVRSLAAAGQWMPAGLRVLVEDPEPTTALGTAPVDTASAGPAVDVSTVADTAHGRFSLGRELSELLASAAGRRPLLILLEDLHRADPITLELLTGLADGVRGVPVVVAGTTRPWWPGADIPDRLMAVHERSPVRITLPGFGVDEAAELVGSITGRDVEAETVRSIVERTGGNAFYLTETARLLRAEGSLVALARVPDGVRDVLRRRLRLLPQGIVEILRLAAVIGRDVDIEILARTTETVVPTGLPAPGAALGLVEEAVDVGVRAGFLVEYGVGAIRFAHIVVRETLYDDVPVVRRRRWHAGVAAVLAEVGSADIAARAHHLTRAGTLVATRVALETTAAAADQAMARYVPERAVELYAQALHALDRLVPEEAVADRMLLGRRVDLLCRRSRAQLAAGAGAAALATRMAAVEAAERSGDDRCLVGALTAWDLPMPWTTRPYGTFDSHLVALLERSLRLADLGVLDRCKLLCALVSETAGADQLRAFQAAAHAETLARSAADPVLIGLALHARGTVLLHDSDLSARLPLAEELCRIGEQSGLAIFALIGHEFVAQSAVANGDPVALTEALHSLEALVKTYRWRQGAAVVAMHRAVLAHLTGELDAADHHYRSAITLLRDNGGLDVGWIGAISLFSVAVSAGRAAELVAALEVLRPFPPATVDLVAVVLAAAGRQPEATELRRGAPEIPRDFFRSLRLTGRALAVLALAVTDEADGVYDQLLEFAGQLGGGVTGAFAFLPVDALLGDLSALCGRVDAARLHYRAAAVVAARCGSAPWRQLIHDRLAQLTR